MQGPCRFHPRTHQGGTSLIPRCAHRRGPWMELTSPNVSLPRAQLWKPSSESITGDQGMPGGQMKPLISITFERESTRMGETGLQNQFEIYCVKGKKKPKKPTHHPRNKLLKLKNQWRNVLLAAPSPTVQSTGFLLIKAQPGAVSVAGGQKKA